MNHRPGWPVRVYMLRSSWPSPKPQMVPTRFIDGFAEQQPHQFLLALVAGRQHDQIGGDGLAVLHPGAVGDKAFDIGELLQLDIALDDQVGAADVEIIAAAAGEVFELPAGIVLAEIELEAGARQPLQQLLVELLRFLRGQRMALAAPPCSGIEVAIRSLSSSVPSL